MHFENPFHHHRHSHSPPTPARITDAFTHVHYKHGARTVTTATLVGTTPTTRTDGSPLALTDITEIDILDDIGDGNGPQKIGTIPNPGATFSFTTGVLTVGTHTFTAVVDDDSGHVSAPSNAAQVQVVATLAAPSAVADLAATLNTSTPSSSSAPAPTAAAAAAKQ
jgi:hypothetical protein